MKKHHFMCAAMLMILILTSACGSSNGPKEEIHTLADAKTDFYGSAAELEAKAEAIVKVKKTEEEENILKNFGRPEQVYGYTKSQVEVEQVFSDDSRQSIEAGDKLTVFEDQFTYTDGEERLVTCHVNRYQKMIPGNEYVLYLEYSQNDSWYIPLAGIFGKVALDGEEEPLVPIAKVTTFSGQSYEEEGTQYVDQTVERIREETIQRFIQK